MKKLILTAIAIMAIASVASASTFSADGGLLEPTHGYTTIADRGVLVNDGSFEGGDCLATPIWTCTTDNGCEWITDLVPLGLWNYDGSKIAWLGGFCGGIATVFTSICQDVDLGAGHLLSWFWMGYINSGGEYVSVTVDGGVVFEYYTDLADHLLDYQAQVADISAAGPGVHNICFNYDLLVAGDNYFLDYVEYDDATATEDANFSTVKALY